MRFSQLPIGQCFEFEGVRYIKTGPLLAAEEAGGKTRFIGKYVLVQPLGESGAGAAAASAAARTVYAEDVVAEFEIFYRRVGAIIDRLGSAPDADAVNSARGELEVARAEFLAVLMRGDSKRGP